MPDGPHILWLEKATKSASQAVTSVTLCGTYWQASTMAIAPASCAALHSVATGGSVPSTLLMAVNANALAPWSNSSRLVRSSRPSGVSGTHRSSMPSSVASMCHGTMLAWCSMCVSTTTSPARRFARPHAAATRLSDSVAFLVKITSLGAGALTNRATAARACS